MDRDLLLLKHELLEASLEKNGNLTLAEAHRMANEKYDWESALQAELGEEGEKGGLL